jgi:hypothetical protein
MDTQKPVSCYNKKKGCDSIKKLLFLYPIEEYMKVLNNPDTIKKLNDTIDKRYRQKGYEVNYLVFEDKDVANLKIDNKDCILKTDITFKTHTTPIEEDVYPYPSNKHIEKELGKVDELVVCGFHSQDCVKRVANHFYNLGVNTLVDLELTELFRVLSSRYYFDEEAYNLANVIEYAEAEIAFLYGEDFPREIFNMDKMYNEPYFKKESFTPTIYRNDILNLMDTNEYHKIK